MTLLLAKAALSALLPIDNSDLSAPKLFTFFNLGLNKKIEVSSVHITISQHLILS